MNSKKKRDRLTRPVSAKRMKSIRLSLVLIKKTVVKAHSPFLLLFNIVSSFGFTALTKHSVQVSWLNVSTPLSAFPNFQWQIIEIGYSLTVAGPRRIHTYFPLSLHSKNTELYLATLIEYI